MTTLKLSSIDGEYYYGNLPGTLQYKTDPIALRNMAIPHIQGAQDSKWSETKENMVAQLLPNTKTAGKPDDWEQVVVMQKTEDNHVWLKGAMKNKATGLIALMTSCNSENGITFHGHRAIKSCQEGWFVGHYRMAAPLVFWSSVKAALNN